MSGKRRSRQARQFARDFFVGLVISLTVLAFSIAGTVEARSAPVVATKSGAIVVEGHPIGMRGPLAQHGFDRVLTLHAVGLGKLMVGYDESESGVGEAPSQHAQLTVHNLSTHRIWGQYHVSSRERPAQSWTLITMVLIFGLMTALTLGLWRNLGRALSDYGHRRR